MRPVFYESFSTNNALRYSNLKPVFEIETAAPCYSVKYSLRNPSLIAVCDESGEIYVVSVENQCEILSAMQAHYNSIFHIDWSIDNHYLLTGSGDQKAGIWDPETRSGSYLVKHTGSVKCVRNSPVMHSVYATASRDGKIYIWDLRTNGHGLNKNTTFDPIAEITQKSEVSSKKNKDPASFTGLEYMSWGNVIVSVEADEPGMRFWDIRKSQSVTQNKEKRKIKPCIGTVTPWTYKQNELIQNIKRKRENEGIRGIMCEKKIMELRSGNSWICRVDNSLLVSSMNNALYLYRDILRMDYDPPVKFTGHKTSFYVKGCISPDCNWVASGSSEGSLYLWNVNAPQIPIIVPNKYIMNEASAVDWADSSKSFIATCSDGAAVTFYDFEDNIS